MNRLAMALIALALMATAVFAATSIRGYEGNVEYINYFTGIQPTKVQFSEYVGNIGQESGSMQVIGTNSAGRITLNINWNDGIGYATVNGNRAKYASAVTVTTANGKATVIGTGGTAFRVSEIPLTVLK
jgi:hypothetical protein